MRGDIGILNMQCRDMKTKLRYAKYLLEDATGLLQCVFKSMYVEDAHKYTEVIKKYMNDLGMRNLEDLKSVSDGELVTLIKSYDTSKWRAELTEKIL